MVREPDGDVELWPDNTLCVEVFCAMATQWSAGGMRYEALPTVLRMMGVARQEWSDLFFDLRVMEREALDQIRSG